MSSQTYFDSDTMRHMFLETEARILAEWAGSPYVQDCFLRIAQMEASRCAALSALTPG
jgi:hypothetical protein